MWFPGKPTSGVTLRLSDAERDAMLRWAAHAGVGFQFGPPSAATPTPDATALAKLRATVRNPNRFGT